MQEQNLVSRRTFTKAAAAAVVSSPLLARAESGASGASGPSAESGADGYLQGRLYKTLKIGMVRVDGSLADKFAAAKEAGFDGIELSAPGFNVDGRFGTPALTRRPGRKLWRHSKELSGRLTRSAAIRSCWSSVAVRTVPKRRFGRARLRTFPEHCRWPRS